MLYTTLYLQTTPDDRGDKPPRYIIRFKTLEKKLLNVLPEDRRSLVERDVRKMEEFISDVSNLESDNGLPVWGIAIFANSSENYFEVRKLPFALRNTLVADRTPYVRGVVAVEREFGRNLLVHFSHKHLDMYIASLEEGFRNLRETLEITDVHLDKGGVFKQSAPNREVSISTHIATKNINRILEEKDRKLLKFVADAIFEITREKAFDRIFVSGPSKLESKLLEYMHPYNKQIFAGFINLPSKPSKNEIIEKLVVKLIEIDREEEKQLKEEFLEKLGVGLAVKGLDEVIEHAIMGNVMKLLVPQGYAKEGFVCYPSGIFHYKGECLDTDREVWRVPDVVDTLVEHVISIGGDIEVVHHDELKSVLEGDVGAILRFKV